MTRDERFLKEIYKIHQKGKKRINPQKLGAVLGLSERQIASILRGLMRSNLVKRLGPDEIGLTPRGEEVALTLTL